ncbi:unnamed protein product [Mucor circinelloides]
MSSLQADSRNRKRKEDLVTLLRSMINEGGEFAVDDIHTALKEVGLRYARSKDKKTYLFALLDDKTPRIATEEIVYETKKMRAASRKLLQAQGDALPETSSAAGSSDSSPPKKRSKIVDLSSDDDDHEEEDHEADSPPRDDQLLSNRNQQNSPPAAVGNSSSSDVVLSEYDKIRRLLTSERKISIVKELESAMNNPEIFSNFVNNAIKDIREGFQADADRECLPNFPPLPTRLENMEDARPFIQHWKSTNTRKQYISFVSNVGSILLSLINELGKRLNKSESILSLVESNEKDALRKQIVNGERLFSAMRKFGFIVMITPIFNNSLVCRITPNDWQLILSLCEKVRFKEQLKTLNLFVSLRPEPITFVTNLVKMINEKNMSLLNYFPVAGHPEKLAIEDSPAKASA